MHAQIVQYQVDLAPGVPYQPVHEVGKTAECVASCARLRSLARYPHAANFDRHPTPAGHALIGTGRGTEHPRRHA